MASEAWGAVLGALREHGRLAQRAEGVQALLVQPGRDAARVVRVPAEWQRLDLATPPATSQTALLQVQMHASRSHRRRTAQALTVLAAYAIQ